MAPVTLEEFGNALANIGVMTPDEWQRWVNQEQPDSAHSAGSRLVEQQVLTEFQAKEILYHAERSLLIGDYLLLNLLGAGGMGQVFRARHRHMERIVAIKLLPPEMTRDSEHVRRFQREVRAAARLSHPNIVAAYDARHEQGLWCLVMEYVEGSDLAALVRNNGPFPLAEAVDAILQAARGLAYAHEEGVIHRDIKPSNLIRDRRGTVRILDMGLARIESSEGLERELTTTGQVMGTVDYISPEQVADTHSADERSDIYSLGCTLHRLVVGEPMYRGKSVLERAVAHQTQPIPSLGKSRADVPFTLDQVFQKMVAKRPADRYQSAAEVVVALERLRSSLPSSATVHSRVASQLEPTATLSDGVDPGSAMTIIGQTNVGSGEVTKQSNPKSILWIGLAVAISLVVFIGYQFSTLPSTDSQHPQIPPAAHKAAEAYEPATSETSVAVPQAAPAIQHAEPAKPWLDPSEQWGAPVNLGLGVNTNENEDHPAVSHDGLSLIFTRGKSSALGDLWECTRVTTAEPFGVAVRLPDELNSTANDSSPFLSPDGLQLWFVSSRPLEEGRTDANLWTAVRPSRSEAFSKPVPLDPSINESGSEMAPFVTPDGLTLLFVRPWTFYEATRTSTDRPFSNPRRLPDVKRKSWASFPRLTADRKTLVFASDTNGSQEIWYATRSTSDDVFAAASRLEAVSAAPVISGPCLSGDEKTLYFSALNSKGAGGMDLWSITRRPNRQLRLSQGAYVIIPELPFVDPGPSTLEAFFTAETSDERDQHVAGWPGPLSFYVSRHQKWSYGLGHSDRFSYAEAPIRVVLGNRVHLAAVRDGKSVKLFLNGRRISGFEDREIPLATPRSPFRIGAPGEKQHFAGLIDELRISNVARYSADFNPPLRHEPDAATLGLYHCDEESGAVLIDASGHGYNGQVANGEWVPVVPQSDAR